LKKSYQYFKTSSVVHQQTFSKGLYSSCKKTLKTPLYNRLNYSGKIYNKFQMDASFICNEVPATDVGVPTHTAQLVTNEIIQLDKLLTCAAQSSDVL
jgi:hypothetical protein